MGEFIVVLAIILVVGIIILFKVLSKILLIAEPNEVIILSGRQRKLASGENIGYRTIRGGRTIKIPLLEKASRMSLETIPLDLSISNAYSKGGIPLALEAIANVKIDSDEPAFGNAVERFLKMRPEEIHAIAKDTLEGNLRGVMASLTPEEVNEDRLKFAETLIDEAHSDLQQLGLKLDTLKITNISDERGYLDSIGRKISAEVVASAKKAEADKKAESEEAEAKANERAEKAKALARQEIEKAQIETQLAIAIAQANKDAETEEALAFAKERSEKAKAKAQQEIEKAQIEARQGVLIAQAAKEAETKEAEAASEARSQKAKVFANRDIEQANIEYTQTVAIKKAQAEQDIENEQNNLRVRKAELEKIAVIKEQEAEIAGLKAKALYEQDLEEERIILQQKRLAADVIEPAIAKKKAMELEAKGQSAHITASGEAELQVLKMKIDAYLAAGKDAEKIFMLNLLPEITQTLASTIKGIQIDKITMIDNNGEGGGNISKLVNQLPGSVVSLSEMIENATGVDILSNFKKSES